MWDNFQEVLSHRLGQEMYLYKFYYAALICSVNISLHYFLIFSDMKCVAFK